MGNHTILLVDYEPRSVERSRKPLADAGFKVEIASDGIAALEAFARLTPDLVLIEAMLPKKHGFEVCQELKKTPEGKRTPILITTGVYKGRKYRSQALHLHGCDEYIEKPIADDALLAVVRRFLDAPAAAPSAPSVGPMADASSVRAAPAKAAAPPAPATKEPAAERPPQPVQPPTAPPTTKPAAAEKKAARDATSKNGPAGKSRSAPQSWGGGASADEGEVTEDEIMARLDAILPPVGLTRASASSVGSDHAPASSAAGPAVAIAETTADRPADLEAVADFLSETESAFVVESIVPAPPVDVRSPESRGVETPILEPTVVPENSDRQEPAAQAQVVPFDEGRSKKQGKKGRNRRKDEPSAIPPPPEPSAPPAAVAMAPFAGAATASAPSATLAAVRPILESPSSRALRDEPSPEVKTARRGVPIWAWLLGAVAVAITVYFAFFRGAPPETVRPVTAPAPTGRSVPAEPNPAPPAETGTAALAEPATSPLPVLGAASGEPEPPSAVAQPPQDPAPSAPSLPEASRPSDETKGRRSGARLPSAPAVRAPSRATPAPTTITPDPTVSSSTPPVPAPSAPPRADGAADLTGLGIEPVPTQILTASPTTKRAVMSGDLVSLAEADYPPIALNRPAPSYPTRARLAGQSGTVVLNVLVGGTGRVADVQVLRTIPGSDLHVAAAAAARTWTYKPATKDGLPVKVWKSEQVVFGP